jgi:nucleoside-diphosphate-sugar epimerase
MIFVTGSTGIIPSALIEELAASQPLGTLPI